MFLFKIVAPLALFCGFLHATAIPPHHEVHEKRGSLHPRWTREKRVEPQKLLPMRIGLAQANLDQGYEHLMDV